MALAQAAAVEVDNSRAGLVFISGAQGASSVNGFWRATAERQGGRVVYVKVGDASNDRYCIEHFGGKWQLKRVTHKGQNLCTAYVPGGCALEACTSRVWSVSDGETCVPQSSVKMLCGADAEREVSRRSLSALCNAPSVTACARACACARAFIVTVLLSLKNFMSHRPRKARSKLLLKQKRKPKLPRRRLLKWTTPELASSLSAAPRAFAPLLSMDFGELLQRGRRDGSFMSRSAVPTIALSTLGENGNSNLCPTRAGIVAAPKFLVVVHWRPARHACGSCGACLME